MLKNYVMPNGHMYQFEEGEQPAVAVPYVKPEEKAAKPKDKAVKPANKTRKAVSK